MNEYDVIVFGGGIAGLWIGNTLRRARYNVIVIEQEQLGAGQTLASQGMIHGGAKYGLEGLMSSGAATISNMPARWRAAFEGRGEVDLAHVRFLSETQLMWPAGSLVSAAAVWAAATLVKADCKRLKLAEYPEALGKRKKVRSPVYALPEMVLDVRSLIVALAQPLDGCVLKGEITRMTSNGEVTVSGQLLCAQVIVFAAGAGNEVALEILNVREPLTQRRPLRQIMVRPLPHALFSHGIADNGRPRITITSHSIGPCEYAWYIGGALAEKGAHMDEATALRAAQTELRQLFPEIEWEHKLWATLYVDRAEPFSATGGLPAGPFVHQCGRVLMVWPTKLTLAPALSDCVLARLAGIEPTAKSPPPSLPRPEIGCYPWEQAKWRRLT
jgi:glycine/D-amino acid oxidase-like deaminating enzyme